MVIRTKILGTGAYLPSNEISSEDLEKKLGFAPGTIEKSSGVKKRYHVEEETSSDMGAAAVRQALQAANLDFHSVDALVSVGGVPQQAIPSTAALIHQKLGLKNGVAFDINASCLSFLTGLVCMGNLIAQGIYRHVVLVASDIASGGLNPKDPKTASLFGDGAAAVVLGPAVGNEGILESHFETKSESAQICACEGGGTLFASKKKISPDRLFFKMNGPKLFKAAMPPLLKMYHSFLDKVDGAIDLIIPHQASPFALDLFQKKLKLPNDKIVHIVREYGNMIAASLPFALHKAIEEKRLQRKDRVLLLGTGAGLTIGGVLLEY